MCYQGHVPSGWLVIVPLVLNLRTVGGVSRLVLEVDNGLLSEVDKQLPFTRHISCTFKHIHFVKYFVVVVLVWTKEVIVSNPQSNVVVGTFVVVVAAGYTIGRTEGAVKAFYHLLERAEFFRHLIFVGETDYLCDIEEKVFSELTEELLCSQWIGSVSVSDEAELFR